MDAGAKDHGGDLTGPASYDVSTRGAMIHVELDGRWGKLVVGEGEGKVEIEVSPTGPLPGDYFVGTFDGSRMTALVQLSEDYELVQEIDLVHMVEAERDVSGFPCIAVVGEDGARRLVVVGGGTPARLELFAPPPEVAQGAD